MTAWISLRVLKCRFVEAMIAGNTVYDQKTCRGLYVLDEALTILSNCGVLIEKELLTVSLLSWQVVDWLCKPDCQTAGVVVHTPVSMAVCGAEEGVVVFDTLMHGASIPLVGKGGASAYLGKLFSPSPAHFHLLRLAESTQQLKLSTRKLFLTCFKYIALSKRKTHSQTPASFFFL